MKYEAVIFDLFGTLVDSYSYEEYQGVLRQVASVLTIPFNDFRRLWHETAQERNLGTTPTVEANIENICRKFGVQADDTKIKLAIKIRYDFIADTMKPRQDAVDVLSRLKSQGLRIGLISNCSPETPIIWENTPFPPLFDVALFSASVGIVKPDPRIYQMAIEQLATEPESCLYIGDGSNQELTGALKVGMHPVMIRVDYEDETQIFANKESWEGPVISSLKDVLTLLE
jgi:putative hydrolase of the HAD superfamily